MKRSRLFVLVGLLSVGLIATSCGGASDPDDGLGGKGGDDGGATGGSGGSAGSGATGTGGAAGDGGSTASGGSSGSSTGGNGTGGAGGGTGGSGAVGNDACTTICEAADAANCPNEGTIPACAARCGELAAICASSLDAVVTCVEGAGSFSCGQDGRANLDGCTRPAIALADCVGCRPVAGESACESCQKEQCCAELQGFLGASDTGSLLECLEACPSASSPCAQECYTQNPDAAAMIEPLVTCERDSCGTECQ
jgi:hypothetical protein